MKNTLYEKKNFHACKSLYNLQQILLHQIMNMITMSKNNRWIQWIGFLGCIVLMSACKQAQKTQPQVQLFDNDGLHDR